MLTLIFFTAFCQAGCIGSAQTLVVYGEHSTSVEINASKDLIQLNNSLSEKGT